MTCAFVLLAILRPTRERTFGVGGKVGGCGVGGGVLFDWWMIKTAFDEKERA